MITTYPVKIKSINEIATNTSAIIVERPANYRYLAGQFTQLIFPNCPEDQRGNWRWMSLASAPHEDDLLYVMRNTVSPYNTGIRGLKVGATIEISDAKGNFVLPTKINKPLVFLTGGIGITPVLSMLRDLEHTKSEQETYVFYSDWTPSSCAYLDEIKNYTNSYIKSILTMTNVDKNEEWTGETRRISKELLNDHLDEPSSALYYTVGSTRFVNGMIELMESMNINKENIVLEKFKGL